MADMCTDNQEGSRLPREPGCPQFIANWSLFPAVHYPTDLFSYLLCSLLFLLVNYAHHLLVKLKLMPLLLELLYIAPKPRFGQRCNRQNQAFNPHPFLDTSIQFHWTHYFLKIHNSTSSSPRQSEHSAGQRPVIILFSYFHDLLLA